MPTASTLCCCRCRLTGFALQVDPNYLIRRKRQHKRIPRKLSSHPHKPNHSPLLRLPLQLPMPVEDNRRICHSIVLHGEKHPLPRRNRPAHRHHHALQIRNRNRRKQRIFVSHHEQLLSIRTTQRSPYCVPPERKWSLSLPNLRRCHHRQQCQTHPHRSQSHGAGLPPQSILPGAPELNGPRPAPTNHMEPTLNAQYPTPSAYAAAHESFVKNSVLGVKRF